MRIHERLKRYLGISRPDVLIYSATWIDEVWVRSTAIAAHEIGLHPRIAISGDQASWPSNLQEPYRHCDVEILHCPTVETLHALQARVVVTASSGVPRNYFGASLRRLVHMPHSLASMHTIYEQHCFDGYDSLFAAGPHHIEEFRMLTNYNHLPERTTYAIGYGKFDLMKPCSEQVPLEERKPEVLIAPSWGENNLIATCGRKLVQILVDQGLDVTLRPHPSFFVEEDKSLAELISDFSTHPNVSIERSTGTSTAMWTADALISDYSGFALEYAALRRRPVVFVDVPRKLLNPAWEDLALPAVEIDHRDQLGEIVPCQPETISEAVKAQLSAEDVGDKAISQYLFDMPSVGATAAATLKQDFPEVYG